MKSRHVHLALACALWGTSVGPAMTSSASGDQLSHASMARNNAGTVLLADSADDDLKAALEFQAKRKKQAECPTCPSSKPDAAGVNDEFEKIKAEGSSAREREKSEQDAKEKNRNSRIDEIYGAMIGRSPCEKACSIVAARYSEKFLTEADFDGCIWESGFHGCVEAASKEYRGNMNACTGGKENVVKIMQYSEDVQERYKRAWSNFCAKGQIEGWRRSK